MRNWLVLFCYLFISLNCFSQQASLDWFSSIGGKGIDEGFSIKVDVEKNVYIAGVFSGKVDFNSGSDSFYLNAIGEKDVFILKLNTNGEFIWAKSFGGKYSETCNSINIDRSGNILTTGSYKGKVDFDPNSDSFFSTSINSSSDVFIQKLNRNGELVWVKSFGGTGIEDGKSIDTDSFGNIYSTGYFEISGDFDPSSNSANLYSIGSNDIYISKLDSNGNFRWTKRIGGTLNDEGKCIKTDNFGGVYLTGFFQAIVYFDQSTSLISDNNSHDIFILRLDSIGALKWVKKYGGFMPDFGESIDVDKLGNVYCTGSFYGIVEFDSDTGKTQLSGQATDVFFIKMDTLGNTKLLKQFGGYLQEGYSIAVDENFNIYIAGRFVENIVFDLPTNKNVLRANINDNAEIFIAMLDQFGNFNWAKSIGGIDNQINKSITLDNDGNVYTTGYFSNEAVFIQFKDTFQLKSVGSSDIYIQKLKRCIPTLDTLIVSACNNFIPPSKKHNWIKSGYYTDVIMNIAGCDSVIIYNLKITSPIKSVTIGPKNLISNSDSSLFQWLDCDSLFYPILGENNQTYTPKKSGRYAVQINRNGCIDTSDCVNFTHSNLETNSLDFFQVFPNPNYGSFIIKFGEYLSSFSIVITNNLGQVISENHFENKTYIEYEDLLPGVYLIQISNNLGSKYIKKIIVL